MNDDALLKILRERRRALAVMLGRGADDPQVHLALAALRGLGIEQTLAPLDDAAIDELIARFRSWIVPRAEDRADSGR